MPSTSTRGRQGQNPSTPHTKCNLLGCNGRHTHIHGSTYVHGNQPCTLKKEENDLLRLITYMCFNLQLDATFRCCSSRRPGLLVHIAEQHIDYSTTWVRANLSRLASRQIGSTTGSLYKASTLIIPLLQATFDSLDIIDHTMMISTDSIDIKSPLPRRAHETLGGWHSTSTTTSYLTARTRQNGDSGRRRCCVSSSASSTSTPT